SRARRVAVYGFHHPELIPAIEQLVARGEWEVPLWYGRGRDRRWTEDIANWHIESLGGELTGDVDLAANDLSREVGAAAFDAFLDQVARNPALIDQPFATYRRLWQGLLLKFDRQLQAAAIDRVVWQNL